MHSATPYSVEYVPNGHDLQEVEDVAPSVGPYFPGAHNVHSAAPDDEYDPFGHFSHEEAPWREYFPEEHFVHFLYPLQLTLTPETVSVHEYDDVP